MKLAYLDTSAFVKTIVAEPESDQLARWLTDHPLRVSCALLRTEAIRALRPHGADAVTAARRQLRAVRLVRLDDRLLDAAGDVPGEIRALDAIHLAAALSLGSDLDVLVTYDRRMEAVAGELGITVASP